MAFVNELNKPAPRPIATVVGPEALRLALGAIPHQPGIYKMLDAAGKILYVGKAKDLYNRVGSYANITNHNNRILRMVSQVAAVETIVTQNEAEALLVEASTIKRFSPRYNILLKDDKSFPYLRIDTSHAFPRIEKHRGAQNKPGEYFGPFASVGALNDTLALLQKIFLLRPCADTVFKNRTRPCLQYQIKRCSAPCVGYADTAHYAEQLKRARDFLKGRHRDVQEALSVEMDAASAAMEYEKAALLRDRIRALTQVQQEQGLRTTGLADADVIALARRGSKSVAQVYFFRDGSHFGNQSFHPRHEAEASDAEVMAGFLGQFYQSHMPPPEILVSLLPGEAEPNDAAVALYEEAFAMKAGYKVAIRQPQRGDKLTLITNALANAQSALARAEMEQAAVAKNLTAAQALFGLPHVPQRIEVYDNSHISGTNAIGAFIVATPDGFDKRSYRTFTIKNTQTVAGDDYAMMREVFQRRFKGLKKDAGGAEAATAPESSIPDLILIDGGLGQLHAVEQALAAIGVTGLPLVAIAKGEDRNAGREWFHMAGRAAFQLPVGDPLLHYLQRLRDEVHRFAIGTHRNKRSASLTTSALDGIPGIGSTRKRALLQHFGSRADVETASLSELEKVKGISKTTARSIYDYFHG
ncbi:MAG: excinuclease ABC subunit UvrC [Pseudomonadota bacterium]